MARKSYGSLVGGLIVIAIILAAYYWLLPWLRSLDQKAELKWPFAAATGETVVQGTWGKDKDGLLGDPEVGRILAEKYGLRVEGSAVSSLSQALSGSRPAGDFAWTSSATSAEMLKGRIGAVRRRDVLAHSPLVILAWSGPAASLRKAKLAEKRGDAHYLIRMDRLASILATDTPWSELGLDVYGSVNVGFPDPKRSDEGLAFIALLANEANGGTAVGTSQLPAVLPPLGRLYERQGLLEAEPEALLDSFLSKGAAVRPMIATYECQLRERERGGDREDVVVLYPDPTIWSDHVFLSITAEGQRLADALKDERIQRIAWERHGLRPGGAQPAPAAGSKEATGSAAVPPLEAITQTPRTGVMKAIIDGL